MHVSTKPTLSTITKMVNYESNPYNDPDSIIITEHWSIIMVVYMCINKEGIGGMYKTKDSKKVERDQFCERDWRILIHNRGINLNEIGVGVLKRLETSER